MEIACDDDSCGFQSRMTFAISNGTTYYIRSGTFASGSTPGDFGLLVTECCGGSRSSTYGTGTTHPNFGPAALTPITPFAIGETAQLELSYDNQLGDPGALLLGLAQGNFPIFGGTLLVDQILNARATTPAPFTTEDFT